MNATVTVTFIMLMRLVFFRLTPDKALKFKGEKCAHGMLSKDHIIFLMEQRR
jgi:hypothetical protein